MAAPRLSVFLARKSKIFFSTLPTICATKIIINPSPGNALLYSRARVLSQPQSRGVTTTTRLLDEASENATEEDKPRDASHDRTKVIPVETSVKYMKSKAYKDTYGDEPVWKPYRRNHKGAFAPLKTRKKCIRKGVISTGNPCPICRDEYLVLDYTNVDLLKQFINPHDGQVLSYSKTGLCQHKHQELLVAVEKARDHGKITFDVPFREYDYAEFYPRAS